MSQQIRITFNNGLSCPILGLGTWKSKPGEVYQAVSDAINIGYRHIDCAHLYGNEKEIGQAISDQIKSGVVKREDLFITSKLLNTHHHPDLVEKAFETSLSYLGLNYLDLYLIHWPMEDDDSFPLDTNRRVVYSDVDHTDTWQAMENLVEKGLIKSIGLSNFDSKQIERVLKIAKIKPVTNQVECQPYLAQRDLLAFCKANDIALTAYSPLGNPNRPWAKIGEPRLLRDSELIRIAAKYKKTAAQVLIRYAIDRGMIVIAKSVTKTRIKDNFNVWDFALSKEDHIDIEKGKCLTPSKYMFCRSYCGNTRLRK